MGWGGGSVQIDKLAELLLCIKKYLKKKNRESWIDNFMIRCLLGLILCIAANTRKIAKEDTCKNVCP